MGAHDFSLDRRRYSASIHSHLVDRRPAGTHRQNLPTVVAVAEVAGIASAAVAAVQS